MRENRFDGEKGKHFTPQRATEFLRREVIGRYYKTHGELYDLSPDMRILGTLESIYSAMLQAPCEKELYIHQQYLLGFWKDDTETLAALHKQLKRIHLNVCGGVWVLGKVPGIRKAMYCDIQGMAKLYYKHRVDLEYSTWNMKYFETRDWLNELVQQLRQIRDVDDMLKLDNIGKATVARIKKEMKAK